MSTMMNPAASTRSFYSSSRTVSRDARPTCRILESLTCTGASGPRRARDGIAHVKNNAMGFVERSVETADLRTQGALERLALRDNVNIDAGCSNRSKIRSAQKCYPCLRYVVSPMCPGRTLCVWSGRADLNRGPPAPKVNSTTLSSCLVYVFRASCITV